jgi:hypothetical protein
MMKVVKETVIILVIVLISKNNIISDNIYIDNIVNNKSDKIYYDNYDSNYDVLITTAIQ